MGYISTQKDFDILKIIFENQDAIKEEEHLYSFVSKDDAIFSHIIKDLKHSTNCHIASFKDLKDALIDLYKAYEVLLERDGEVLMVGHEVLRWWNSDKYGYTDEHDRFWKLKIITDSDFIPYKTFTNEEYHIVYDILYNDACGSNAYDVVASYYNRYKTNIGRKVALKHWIKCFQIVIDSLSKWKERTHEEDVCIYIPFLNDYKETASHVIDVFEMAQDASNLLRNTNGEVVQIEKPEALVKILDMKSVFQAFQYRISQTVGEDKAMVIHDEMVRRGLCPNTKYTYKEDKYRTCIIGAYEESPAENKHVSLEERKEKSIKDRAAIIYYMLKDDVETSMIQKIIHYVCNPTKEYKGANPSDTIYTYVAHPEKYFLDKADRIDYIKETLQKYHFDEEYINKNIK